MTKAELVHAISKKTGHPVRTVKEVLDGFTDVVTDALKSGKGVSITSFGKFYVAERREREGRNPATGEKIKIAARRLPAFKAGQILKKVVNEK